MVDLLRFPRLSLRRVSHTRVLVGNNKKKDRDNKKINKDDKVTWDNVEEEIGYKEKPKGGLLRKSRLALRVWCVRKLPRLLLAGVLPLNGVQKHALETHPASAFCALFFRPASPLHALASPAAIVATAIHLSVA
jgi:hypothetical protein